MGLWDCEQARTVLRELMRANGADHVARWRDGRRDEDMNVKYSEIDKLLFDEHRRDANLPHDDRQADDRDEVPVACARTPSKARYFRCMRMM